MATEQRLIDANELPLGKFVEPRTEWHQGWNDALDAAMLQATTVDAVSRGVHDQVRWERDVAIHQLEEHGISFGCIAPDVVKVVRCKDCKHYMLWEDSDDEKTCAKSIGLMVSAPDDFCSYGERRTNA